MRFSVLGVLLILAIGSSAARSDEPPVLGDGRVKEEIRSLAPFRRVEVGSVIEATVAIGRQASVTVIAEENLLPLITTVVRDGTLVAELEGNRPTEGDGVRGRIVRNHPLRMSIVVPELVRVVVRDAAAAEVDGTGMTTVNLKVVDAGRCKAHDLRALLVDVVADHAASVELSGEAEQLRLVASKAVQIHARDATFRTARVQLGPGGLASLRVTTSVDGSVDTAVLDVTGEPTLRNLKRLTRGVVSYHADLPARK